VHLVPSLESSSVPVGLGGGLRRRVSACFARGSGVTGRIGNVTLKRIVVNRWFT